MNVNLQERRRTPEVMDQPDLDEASHQAALRGLARTNSWGATRQAIWSSISRIARERRLASVRVFEAASGAGDLAIWLCRRGALHNLPVAVDGCDISPIAVDFATRHAVRAHASGARFFQGDVLTDAIDGTYDMAVCSLFLHHLDQSQAISLLQKMAAAARHSVLVDDLRRTAPGYQLARWATQVLTRSPVVHVDAPRSVEAAFTEDEALAVAEEAGLRDARIRRHWPQRFLLTWEHPWMTPPST